eukprot:TRINITY_DN4313_c1_g1_i1.p1 TRINITY_DN4313_c1_g1~~TRINITY_DN4313_c1_g1_i1.p1  ORF type:complete len:124 (-),score=38.39 TRINITY_DN4313_c1_g1_i1:13-384(-)
MNALRCAVINHNFKISKLLIKNGVNLNCTYFSGESILTKVIELNNFQIANLLIQNGININQSDVNNTLPLHRAIGRKTSEICRLLIQNGADINKIDNKFKNAFQLTKLNEQKSIFCLKYFKLN